MSKRVRASIRAGNRGRSLRPRASSLPPAPDSAPSFEGVLETSSSLPPVPETTNMRPVAPSSVLDALLLPSAERAGQMVPARETPVPAPEEPEGRVAALLPPASGPVDAAPHAALAAVLAPATAAAAEAPAPVAVATAPVTVAAAPVAAEVAEVVPAAASAAVTELPAPVATPPLELEAAPIEVAPAPASADAAPGSAAVEVLAPAQPRSAELAAPASSEPATLPTLHALPGVVPEETPAPAAAAEQNVLLAPISERKPANTLPSHVAAVALPSEEAEPVSRRTAAKRGGASADEHDLSSISAEFFREDKDSVPPVIDSHHEIEHDDHAHAAVVLTPETMARRRRLRRIVAGVIAFATVISVAVMGKALIGKSSHSAVTTIAEAKLPAPVEVAPKPAEVAPPKPVEVTPPKPAEVAAPTAVADAPKADEPAAEKADEKTAKASEPAAEKADEKTAKADEKADRGEPKSSDPPGDADSMKKETLALLNRGKLKEAAAMARTTINADPSDAMGYLYLGSALQDLGKWKDGLDTYSECVRNATRGPVHECRQLGGHK